jgi:multidrug efflux system membrane fusion protein
VYVVKDDQTVTVTPVKLGAVQGESTEVQSGVQAGMRVVVDGADKLRDGAKVELVDANVRNAPASPRRSPSKADAAAGKDAGASKDAGSRGGRRSKSGE